jgi:hypothetical protein
MGVSIPHSQILGKKTIYGWTLTMIIALILLPMPFMLSSTNICVSNEYKRYTLIFTSC